MTDKTLKVIDFLNSWQAMNYEKVDSAEDVKVFNVIGTIIQLASNNYMEMKDSFHFVSDVLSLDSDVKLRISTILADAFSSATTIN